MSAPVSSDGIGQIASAKGDKTFVIESPSGRIVTWRQYITDRNRLGSALRKRGVKFGDALVCYGYNSYDWILTRATSPILGTFSVPMNWHLAAPEVAYIVDNCEANTIIVGSAFVPTLKDAMTRHPELFTKVKNIVVWGGDGKGDGIGVSLETVLAEGDPSYPQDGQFLTRSMNYTGGTSGKPKAVVGRGNVGKSPEHLRREAKKMQSMVGVQGLNVLHPNMLHLIAAPLYHAAPGGFLVMALARGSTMVVMEKFDAREFIRLTDQHRVTDCVMPPILVKRVCDLPEDFLRSHNISSLKSVTSVGAPCPMAVKEAALQVGLPLYEFYGSSELGLNTIMQPADLLRKPGSCGRIAEGVEMDIFDEDGKPCPRGVQGLLYIRTQAEYYNAEQKTRDAQLKSDPSWMTVGDIAYIDNDDFVYICDRKIDMIVSGGANIYPAEIEDCLFRLPDIADVAVFGVPNEEYGEQVHAALLLKEGCTATIEDIQTFAREHIAGFKVPRSVSFHADFPRTPSGKILKRQLRDVHWQGRSKL